MLKTTPIFAVLLLIGLCRSSSADTASNPQPSAVSITSVPYHYVGDQIVIPAMINGQGPFNFEIDTGAETVLLSRKVAMICKLPLNYGSIKLAGTTGAAIGVAQAQVATLKIGDAVIRKPICTVAPLPILVDGYIGAPLFNVYSVQVDPGAGQVRLGALGAYTPDPSDVEVPMILRPERVPIVKGTIGGVATIFEIDTGSSYPAELSPKFVTLHNLTQRFQKIGMVTTNSIDGPADAYVYGADGVTIGSNAAVIKGGIPTVFLPHIVPITASYNGRLGAPLLRAFVMTFDYSRLRIYIRPAQAPTAPAVAPIPVAK